MPEPLAPAVHVLVPVYKQATGWPLWSPPCVTAFAETCLLECRVANAQMLRLMLWKLSHIMSEWAHMY